MTRRVRFALVVSVGLIAALPASGAQPPAAASPAVITTWNEIAVNTIAGPAPNGAGKANAEGIMWFGFVQAAVYNAVNGITGEYELYKWPTGAQAPKGASPQAAAAAAAHRVLMTYFGSSPTIAANLDGALTTSLGQIPDGVPKDQGIRYGERAADRLIELRANDGRNAPIVFNVPVAPGVWRPTPPANAPFFDPWLSQVEPLMLDSPSQFRPGAPPAIGSPLYVQEFNEVRDYGVNTGSLRSTAQTQTALFFFDIAIIPIQAALRDLVMRRGLDISDSARLFGAVDMSLADSVIAVWDGKFHYGWWRPITAIREADNDGNPATAGVPGWTPLVTTPPYSDWPSGLSGAIGALSTTLSRLNPSGHVDLNITSPGTGITRHYDDAAVIQQDVIDARVWSGIHFRTADQVGVATGIEVGNWALDHYFAPAKHTVGATLRNTSEVPRPKGAALARGSFSGTYVENKTGATLTWKLTFNRLTGKALAAHIHKGKPGVAGPVIVPLCGPCRNGRTGKVHISKAVVAALEGNNAYVNVHTAKNAAGEIRGQVKVSG
jgi:CHRD domain-containing protein